MAKTRIYVRHRRIHTRKIDRLVARNHMTVLGYVKNARKGSFFHDNWRKFAVEV